MGESRGDTLGKHILVPYFPVGRKFLLAKNKIMLNNLKFYKENKAGSGTKNKNISEMVREPL